jgi:hypothetical protein
MLPKPNSEFAANSKYFLLEEGEVIKVSDQWYNPIWDIWEPVQMDFVGQEYNAQESKPVRRKNNISQG